MAHAKGMIATLAAAAVLGGMSFIATPAPAQAGASTGTWRHYPGGLGYRGDRGYRGYRGGHAAPRYAAPRYAAPRYATPRYYGNRRGNNWGPGLAAGAVGGLALGALAAQPSYGYGYSDGYYGGDCYWTRQQVVDQWGYAHWRRVQVCD